LKRIVLPILQEYVDSGEFSFQTKLKRAVKTNLIWYGIYGLGALIIVLYLIFSETLGE